MQMDSSTKKKALVGVVAVVFAVAVFRYGFRPAKAPGDDVPKTDAGKTENAETAGTDEPKDVSEDRAEDATVVASYKSPAGDEKIGFKVVVDGSGVITDANTEVMAEHAISQKLQTSFAQALPEKIKGKKLSELGPIDKIGGASLTTGAFNDSLDELKSAL
jgi:hypothetical protein